MSALDSQTRSRYERIASMLTHGISQKEIATIVGLSEGRISQILEEDEFKDIYGSISAQYFEEQRELDEGIDGVERRAVAVLLENLRWNKDPDFALRAFAVANKANRRVKNVNNNPIPVQQGARVVINMPQVFIEKARSRQIEGTKVQEKKMVDLLPAERVHSLLGNSTEQELEKIFAENDA